MEETFKNVFLVTDAYGLKPAQMRDPNSLPCVLYSCMMNYWIEFARIFACIFYILWSCFHDLYFRWRTILRNISLMIFGYKSPQVAERASRHRRSTQSLLKSQLPMCLIQPDWKGESYQIFTILLHIHWYYKTMYIYYFFIGFYKQWVMVKD